MEKDPKSPVESEFDDFDASFAGTSDPPVQRRHGRSIAVRWGGHDVIVRDGFVPVVNTLLRYGANLKPFSLQPTEMMFVIQIMSFKWDEDAPFPSYGTIAKHMGISPEYARKLARQLETKGFLRRRFRNSSTNEFDFTPLFNKLAAHVAPAA